MQPLDDLRVIELGEGVSLAFAGKQFADMGADVIKVENPDGDRTRREGPFMTSAPESESSAPFLFFNYNKRGVTIDPANTSGRALLHSLVRTADLILDASPPGTLTDLGLDWTDLAADRPGIVVASLTPFGRTGPYSEFTVEQLELDAMGGPVTLTGGPDYPPLSKPVNVVAAQVGNTFATAALAAVYAAEMSGRGQQVDASAADILLASLDRRAFALLTHQINGEVASRPWTRSGFLPAGLHRCADGFVVIATTPPWVPRMLETLGDPDLADYFAQTPDAAFRPETTERVAPVLKRWLESRTRAEAFVTATLRNGWPIYPRNEPAEVLAEPHFIERDTFVPVEHPIVGEYRYLGSPWRMSEGRFEVRRPAPLLGQHNEEVFVDELGVDRADLARARALGAV